jgi:phosphohistidine phosphatase
MSTRTLVILSHAKADKPAGVADKDRPLNHEGEADAVAAGSWLAEHEYVPDVVICSPSRRTRQTWDGVAQSLTAAPTVSYVERLYGAKVDDLLTVIGELDDDRRTALLVGHNPAVSQLSTELDPSGIDSEGLSTSGIAVHTWSGDWPDCGPGSAKLTAAHTARG